MESSAIYTPIVSHYEACLAEHGDTHRGVDWPNAKDAQQRYQVMLNVIREVDPRPLRLLDFGCGAAHLLEYIQAQNRSDIVYEGLDISPRFIELARRKFPMHRFTLADVLQPAAICPAADYVILNGVFTEKRSLSYGAMLEYMQQVLRHVFVSAKYGIAFNVMSKHVDWERDDLFHLPFDDLARFLRAEISRNYVFRADYGLYEYTVYVYR